MKYIVKAEAKAYVKRVFVVEAATEHEASLSACELMKKDCFLDEIVPGSINTEVTEDVNPRVDGYLRKVL